jgi:uncharacterized protein DUF1996
MDKRTIVLASAVAVVAAAVVVGLRTGPAPESVELALGQRGPALVKRLPGGGAANFVGICRYSHSSQDDPIVFPGQPGATHHHDFFGNVSTDAHSTYESLRAAPTTCRIDGETAAYWTPSLYDSGRLVQPESVRVYYTSGGKDHLTIKPFPAGFRVVAKEHNVHASWACVGSGRVGRNQSSVPTCPRGTHLVLRNRFPDCWNGRDLDSADHTSHMTFSVRGTCPSSHPVPVPAISVNVHYPSDGGDVVLGMPDAPARARAARPRLLERRRALRWTSARERRPQLTRWRAGHRACSNSRS